MQAHRITIERAQVSSVGWAGWTHLDLLWGCQWEYNEGVLSWHTNILLFAVIENGWIQNIRFEVGNSYLFNLIFLKWVLHTRLSEIILSSLQSAMKGTFCLSAGTNQKRIYLGWVNCSFWRVLQCVCNCHVSTCSCYFFIITQYLPSEKFESFFSSYFNLLSL